jgi:hypothetical protein
MRIPSVLLIPIICISFASVAISQSTANAATIHSQGTPAVSSGERLAALNEANKALKKVLPSFTCDETITAAELEHGTVKSQKHVTAQFRVLKSGTGADISLQDDRTLLTIDGKPAKKNKFSSPITLSGFVGLFLSYFSKEDMACYDATLRSESDYLVEYELRKKEDVSGTQCSFITPESTVLVSFDPKTFSLRHFELTQLHAQNITHSTLVLSVDLRPTTLGGETYTLPKTATATITDRTAPRSAQWQSQYSGCVLFKSTATLLPEYTEVPQ